MDLKPAPSGADSLKSPVVEVEAVDAVDMTNADLAVDAMFSDLETDSDSDGWENLSNCEDAIQLLRDDQIRDGLGKYPPFLPRIPALGDRDPRLTRLSGLVPGACTLEEATAYRQRLHAIGKAAFVEETIVRETVTAKKLCTAFGIVPPAFLDDAPDEAYHSLLAIAISREFSRRPKLPQYNTIDDAVRLLRESRNIIVLTGAGVSGSIKDERAFHGFAGTDWHRYRFQRA
ncbi:unnamed protein product [Penicillium olsonii]|uniref:Deacetylase sirtuin-type domain-containing protein n=1 Tax=Penicillium olsonii TaxID=99116 RepID=A0A9W4I503_PENOL|nr:unnamed protein product [Penicillium olsonii]CAG8082303.1 unnamed protein product [Penicillium olsonii]CAG8235910.1 unnamed protein product [Penicillium olsonii]